LLLFIEIPVFPTVTATVTFQSFDWRENLDPNQFTIPFHYREDPKRFPDLWLIWKDISIVHILKSLRRLEEEEEVGMEIPLTNLGNSSTEMTLIF